MPFYTPSPKLSGVTGFKAKGPAQQAWKWVFCKSLDVDWGFRDSCSDSVRRRTGGGCYGMKTRARKAQAVRHVSPISRIGSDWSAFL